MFCSSPLNSGVLTSLLGWMGKVKELQQESGRVAEDSRTLNAAHQNAAAAELASRLKAKLYNPNNQQGLRHKSRHPKTLHFQVRKPHINWVDLQ
jgi:hypothetical protein